MENAATIEHLHFDSAVDFVNAISPRGELFCQFPPGQSWIYRGHGIDSTYELLPSALRREPSPLSPYLKAIERYLHLLDFEEWKELLQFDAGQALTEVSLLDRFLQRIDRNGLRAPGNFLSLKKALSEVQLDLLRMIISHREIEGKATYWPDIGEEFPETIAWPKDEIIPLISLAQHYGLPTRLLDWTDSSFIAAYFAAVDSFEQQTTGEENISVWAVSRFLFSTEINLGRNPDIPFPVKVVDPPRTANPNLNAQSGTFTLFSSHQIRQGEAINLPPLDDLIENAPGISTSVYNSPISYHFTLPASEAGKVLWLIAKEGIDASRLFPGYASIAKSMQQKRWRESPFDNPSPFNV